MSQVTEIVQLQAIDDEASALRAALADIERRLLGNEQLEAARAELAGASSVLEQAQRDQRRVEAQIEGLTSRIEPEEKRLYDGSVKNPKELGSIQHEVELLKQKRTEAEDELLEIMSRLESAEREQGRALQAVSQLENEWEHEQQGLLHEVTRLGDSIARADQRRDLQKSKVDTVPLHIYERVRRKYDGGAAVAKITGGACGGCRIAMPDNLRRKAFSADTLAQCPNCDRILYIG